MASEHREGDDDYLLQGNESYATKHRHFQQLHRLSAFQQLTTKIPPSYMMAEAVGSPMEMRSMTGVISLSWAKVNEDQLCATAWKVK